MPGRLQRWPLGSHYRRFNKMFNLLLNLSLYLSFNDNSQTFIIINIPNISCLDCFLFVFFGHHNIWWLVFQQLSILKVGWKSHRRIWIDAASNTVSPSLWNIVKTEKHSDWKENPILEQQNRVHGLNIILLTVDVKTKLLFSNKSLSGLAD